MQKELVTLMVCGLLVGTAGQASAQVGPEWTDRAYFTLNWAGQSGSTDLNGTSSFPLYDEEARLETSGTAGAGQMIDLSAGARVWRNVSVGLAFNRVASTSDVTLRGSIPHPLIFGRPRDFTQTVPGLERAERAVHLQFGYMWPVNEKLDVHVYAGPSFFRVTQNAVTSVTIDEQPFPHDAVNVQPVASRRSDSPVGGHFGTDVSYKLYTWNRIKIGAGGFLRYAGASSNVRVLDTDVDSDVGGFQGGIGIRLRY